MGFIWALRLLAVAIGAMIGLPLIWALRLLAVAIGGMIGLALASAVARPNYPSPTPPKAPSMSLSGKTAGGRPFAMGRPPAGKQPPWRSRRRVVDGATELRDDLTNRDVFYNLNHYYVDRKNSAAANCYIGKIRAPFKTKVTFSKVFLEGIHQYHPMADRQGAAPYRQGAAPIRRGATFRQSSGGYLKATVFFRGKTATGPCAGRGAEAAIELVRLTDGVWFSPDWRMSLVKRQ